MRVIQTYPPGTDGLLEWMKKNGIEITRENYLDLAYAGKPSEGEDWGAELEVMLLEELRDLLRHQYLIQRCYAL